MSAAGPAARSSASTLGRAAELLVDEGQRADLRGDPDAAERLERLARAVEMEAEYESNVDRGCAVVRRRRGPAGCTIGWYWLHDAGTRAARRALGLPVPDRDEVCRAA